MDASDILTPAGYVEHMIRREKLTQKEAAKRLGISAAYLNDMLQRRRRIGPEMVELFVRHIETQDKEAARRDLHRLGAIYDGWMITP